MNKKCNGTIIYLSRKKDIKDLMKSIKLLHKNFIKRFAYPIIIFNDDFTENDKYSILEIYSNIKFKVIKFEIPSWLDSNRVNAFWPKALGYKHMCRFFSGELFKDEALRIYDWYWRLDSDSYIHSKIKYDIFKFLEENGYIYGYIGMILNDSPSVTKGLWTFIKTYIEENNIKPTFLNEYLNENKEWNRSLYPTNFEISNFNFWRSEKYLKFYNAIDKNGGIFYHRWGDHVIHFLALSIFVKKDKIYCFKDIDYSHQDFRPNASLIKKLKHKIVYNFFHKR